MWGGVENDKGRDARRLDELRGAANGIEVDQAWSAGNENEIGALSRGVSLRPCRGWRVDNRQSKSPSLCCPLDRQATGAPSEIRHEATLPSADLTK